MFTIVVIVHVVVALALILIVLLQTGKGANIGAAFGGGSSSTIFGSRGPATFMSKITAVAAIAFMLTSLSLSIYSGGVATSDSIMQDVTAPAEENVPAPAEETAQESEPIIPTEQAKPIQTEESGSN